MHLLKVPYCANFHAHIAHTIHIIFVVSTRKCSHGLMFKLLQHVYSSSVWALCFSSCFFKAPIPKSRLSFDWPTSRNTSQGAGTSWHSAESNCGDLALQGKTTLITVEKTQLFHLFGDTGSYFIEKILPGFLSDVLRLLYLNFRWFAEFVSYQLL